MSESKQQRIETLEAKISALEDHAPDDHLDQYRAELADLEGEAGPDVDTAAATGDVDPDVALDTLKANYTLDTLADDDALEREIEVLRKRFNVLRHKVPERAEKVRQRKVALETLDGSDRRNWRRVKRTLGAN